LIISGTLFATHVSTETDKSQSTQVIAINAPSPYMAISLLLDTHAFNYASWLYVRCR